LRFIYSEGGEKVKFTRENMLIPCIIIEFLFVGLNIGWIIYKWNDLNPIMILNLIAAAFAFYVGLSLIERYKWNNVEEPVKDDKP
jgi:hypothetical protein